MTRSTENRSEVHEYLAAIDERVTSDERSYPGLFTEFPLPHPLEWPLTRAFLLHAELTNVHTGQHLDEMDARRGDHGIPSLYSKAVQP